MKERILEAKSMVIHKMVLYFDGNCSTSESKNGELFAFFLWTIIAVRYEAEALLI